jgi:hypothetical protein
MINKIRKVFQLISKIYQQNRLLIKEIELQNTINQTQFTSLYRLLEKQMLLTGKEAGNRLKNKMLKDIHEAEFKVFSQWGDDGIIQYLINQINIPVHSFIEFGVENYTESNTRFLLVNNNWIGLVMDGSSDNIAYIQNDEIYWQHDLTAVCAFIDTNNINNLISEAGFSGEIGLLHIDIDGNDYWVWKAIKVVSPVVVIVEYNSSFGKDRAITIPYNPTFQRMQAHYSGLYAGASLLALCDLAEEKGYHFIGTNSAGNNAYFVRKDKIGNLQVLTPSEGYVKAKFREHRNEDGILTYKIPQVAIRELKRLQVFNTRTNSLEDLS